MTWSTDHGEEDAKLGVHVNVVSVGEDKVFAPLLLARENDGDLLGGDGQNGEVDAVELIEAAPGAGLSQTWKIKRIFSQWIMFSLFSDLKLCIVTREKKYSYFHEFLSILKQFYKVFYP